MEKHIQLVGILNIAYRAMLILVALILVALAAGFRQLVELLVRLDPGEMGEIPYEILDIVPLILLVVAALMTVMSTLGIIAGAAVLTGKRWGRVLMLVISFFTLLRIPVGTVLGGYSIWVLMHDETIRLFDGARTPG